MVYKRWARSCACPLLGMAVSGSGSELAQEGLEANDVTILILPESICFQEASERPWATGQAVLAHSGPGHSLLVALAPAPGVGSPPPARGQAGAREGEASAGVS